MDTVTPYPLDPENPDFVGMELLRNPSFNKGTAFSPEERAKFKLRGLLPAHFSNLESQVTRCLAEVRSKQSAIAQYMYLMSVQDRNETVFYALLDSNLEEMMPLIYTPTVGLACQRYSHIWQRARGMYLSINDRGDIRSILDNWGQPDVRVIVATDGERILGLGDLGANGMGIPVGKLSLYTACAGIHYDYCLPMLIDMGTNNVELRNDPLYLGLRQERTAGKEFDDFMEELISAVVDKWPKVLFQFEDFGNSNAFRLLEAYRDRLCTFNDDIEGTASVALAGLYSAMNMKKTLLKDEVLVFYGAGEAGTGIADLVVASLMAEGVTEAVARRKCYFIDSKGLVCASRTALAHHKVPYAHDVPYVPDLLSAVKAFKPTALIGVAGVGPAFTQEILELMSSYNKEPIIFAMSNPTSQAECTAEEAFAWSKGTVLFASGSPFPNVSVGDRVFKPGQGNNSYIFPGVGLACTAMEISRVRPTMFLAAARSLASQVTAEDVKLRCLYPSLNNIREVSCRIAVEVAKDGLRLGLARIPEPADLLAHMKASQYRPVYRSFL